ncbi:MHS family MFS transporter [Solihabitans fulvus]|uniref:Putative proline/betaine transporter n=1 Tax=Solihabitans fulvus TaxID=1892852 RepID=A0A5B2XFX0_9PSEU|nr:MFS transporter [Solihabitans fulvus]KAA2262677.1 MHS family MFS transporter [Solihabitans fulvus]
MATKITGTSRLGRVVAAGMVGTTVEFYDFFLYGAASATIFGPVFFPKADGLLGVLLALVTYAVGFAARPVGGLVFGHYGDRIGRKRLLVASLVLMGGSSVLIGLLPGYAQIGVAAPILLTLLRLVQGFALGGEFGGAVLLVAEHGPAARRGFWTSWPQTGGPLGNLLATGALAAMAAVTSQAQYQSWGWRVPFVASVLLVLVGLWVRLRVEESPLFRQAAANRAPTDRPPLLAALRRHPRALFSVFAARVGENATFYVFTLFLLVYAKSIGLPAAVAAGAVTIGSVGQVLAMLAGGALSDRFGRRVVAVPAAVAAGLWAAAFFPLVASRQQGAVVAAVVVGLVCHGVLTGAQSAFYAELFDTSVRYSGVSLGYQAATVVAGATAPLVGAALLRSTGSTVPVAILLAGCLALTIVGMLVAPETRNRELS